jgi:multidrug efflux pump
MLSLWAGGFPLGFNPIIGTAGLIGVAINGSIVVLAALRANPAARAGDHQAIVAETIGASRHILSTTLTTVGGFLPLLFLSGGQFWPPLAIVLAGGVGLSALLSLVFTPVAYAWLAGLHGSRETARVARAPLGACRPWTEADSRTRDPGPVGMDRVTDPPPAAPKCGAVRL